MFNYKTVLSWFFLTVVLAACVSQKEVGEVYMAAELSKFDDVTLNSDEQNECSPTVDPELDFEGVLINAPELVILDDKNQASDGSFAAVPICGYYEMELSKLMQDSVLTIFAKNIESQEVYEGAMIDDDPGTLIEDDEPPFEAEDLAGQFIGAYFNPNLPHYVAIPNEPGRYQVRVRIANELSNIVEIELRAADEQQE